MLFDVLSRFTLLISSVIKVASDLFIFKNPVLFTEQKPKDYVEMDTSSLLINAMLYVFLPLWGIAGFADWCCHKATKIEVTSGVKESTKSISPCSLHLVTTTFIPAITALAGLVP